MGDKARGLIGNTEAVAPAGEPASETEEWGPADGFERASYTLLADLLTCAGFAHGYCSLEDETEVAYKVSCP